MHEMRKRNGGGHHKMTAREIFQKRGGRDDVNFDVNDYKSSTMSISMEAKLMQLRSQDNYDTEMLVLCGCKAHFFFLMIYIFSNFLLSLLL
jgi:hypothetical protein